VVRQAEIRLLSLAGMLLQSCALSLAGKQQPTAPTAVTQLRPSAKHLPGADNVYLYHLKQRLYFLTRDATTLLYIWLIIGTT
jgi:hypothetical protein